MLPLRSAPTRTPYAAATFFFVSGQTPLDPASGTLVGKTIEEQTQRVLDNLELVLGSCRSHPWQRGEDQRLLPETIIDDLESIEVQEQEGKDEARLGLGMPETVFDSVQQHGSIGLARQ